MLALLLRGGRFGIARAGCRRAGHRCVIGDAIQQAQRSASVRADLLLVRLAASPPPPAQAAAISTAIEPFAGDVIVKMLMICAFLRRVTA